MSYINTTFSHSGFVYKQENDNDIKSFHNVINELTDNKALPNEKHQSQEPSWERLSTETFLNECIRRKIDLRDRSIRRRKIFSEIRLRMMTKGYRFDESSLDRKFRNLKTHFFYVRNNNNSTKRSRRISWPYFEKMSIIFPTVTVRNSRAITSVPNSTPTSQETSKKPSKRRERSQESNYSNPKKLETLRNELLAFEERRTAAIEAIAVELHEANRLSRIKLELDKKIYERKCMNLNEC